MHELVSYLEMSNTWDSITHYPNDIEVAKFLVLSKWKEIKDQSNFKTLADALTKMDISTHVLCQVRKIRRAETDIPLEYLDCIPTDEVLDRLAPQIGHIYFQLGAEIGLSILILETIQSNNPRDLAAQNREVLFAWREDRSVKPTIRVLVQALVNIGRGARCLQKVLENVDPNTLGFEEERESILTKLGQLNSDDFKSLVSLGTFASYENRVYLAGPCNIGKSSLASILIGEDIPKQWFSTDGLIIHFGRNGIDLKQKKMIPLTKGSGDVLTKLILGNPEIKEQYRLETESSKRQTDDEQAHESQDVPESKITQNEINNLMKNQQQRTTMATSKQTPYDGHQSKSSKPSLEMFTSFLKPKIHTANSIQYKLANEGKKDTYIMNIAPSDLVDFGGQKSFDMTHQLFIQHRGTFVLMFDGRKGLNTKLDEYLQGDVTAISILEHWINSVLTYCSKSADKMPRIVFAATHSDSFSEDEKKKQAINFKDELTKKFSSHQLRDHIMYDRVFFINATNAADLDIDRLTDTLVGIAFQQSTWGQQMPIVWVPLDLQLSDMRTNGVTLITKARLYEINKSNNEFSLSERRLEDFLLVQNSIGKLLYFNEPALRNFIVIQPSAMVNILRAFITDIMFWPKNRHIRDILESLSSTGVLKKTDLFTLWSQPAFKDILTDDRTKEYVVQVLLHLDILVEPKRYTDKDTTADLFLVPCIVKSKIPPEMQNTATDDRTLCIAYHLKETVVPSALSFKLIGAAISIWPVKVVDSRFGLYFQAVVMDADNRNELHIRVEDQKIVAYLINEESKAFISPDLATKTQECLTLALGRILQLYGRSFGKQDHQVTSDLFDIEVGEVCKGETCLIPLADAEMQMHWRCKNGKQHETKNLLKLVKNKAPCDPNCTGVDADIFCHKPMDHHFVHLARTLGIGDFYNFFFHLGMSKADYDNLNFCYFANPMNFMLMGLFQWRDREESGQSSATFGKLLTALTAIDRQHYLCQVHRQDHSLIEKARMRLQDVPSDEVIDSLTEKTLIGDCVVHLGIELGRSIEDIRKTMHNFPKDLDGQIHDLLIKWKKTDHPKPTIFWLMTALRRVEAAKGLNFLEKTYGVE
ncbi:uncharacterized protein LOC143054232 [Mytilus galloprovincialis]|uniref:uncharacterized protein LOC143054232 n=1 Tax=Mytilus galloprovincialis TaxID=29158 RepID=UPI003F7B74AB